MTCERTGAPTEIAIVAPCSIYMLRWCRTPEGAMHIAVIAGIWILIQTVPLAIMFFIYFFFKEQNFFQIEGFWKGIIASGPIAAYVFLTWIGFRYFKDLSATFDPQDD